MIIEILGGALLGGALFGGSNHTAVVHKTTAKDIADAIVRAEKTQREMAEEEAWLEDTGVSVVPGDAKITPISLDIILRYEPRGLKWRGFGGFHVEYIFGNGLKWESDVDSHRILCGGSSAFPRPEEILASLMSSAKIDAKGAYIPCMIRKRVVPSTYYAGEGNKPVRLRFCHSAFDEFVRSISTTMTARKDFMDIANRFDFSWNRGLIERQAAEC